MQAVSSLLDTKIRHANEQAMADDNPDFALTFVDKALGETRYRSLKSLTVAMDLDGTMTVNNVGPACVDGFKADSSSLRS